MSLDTIAKFQGTIIFLLSVGVGIAGYALRELLGIASDFKKMIGTVARLETDVEELQGDVKAHSTYIEFHKGEEKGRAAAADDTGKSPILRIPHRLATGE